MAQISFWNLFLVFIKLGATSFGGPLAHIALMDKELVEKRRWITRQKFLELHAFTQLIPGPNSTELAMAIARQLGGWRGQIAATLGFTAPAFFASCVLACLYQAKGQLPLSQDILTAVRPVILVIIAQALFRFARQLDRRTLLIIGSLALLAKLMGAADLLILVIAGGACVLHKKKPRSRFLALIPPEQIFGVFFKIGGVLFGSGYTLLLYLQDDLVHRLGWLTESQVLDAITVGQITPGPLFSTAAFIGFLLQGWPGAGLATLGIFGPAFLMIVCSGYLLPKLERRAEVPHFLLGVNTAAMGLMVHVCFGLARIAVVDSFSLILAVLALWLLESKRMDAGLLILLSIAAGLVMSIL